MRRGFARWIGLNFAFVTAEWFVGQWNLKMIQAIVISFQSLVPSFSYWDLVTPFWIIFFFATFWIFIVKRHHRA